jgi:membrane-bound lytic murein transglycosylase D
MMMTPRHRVAGAAVCMVLLSAASASAQQASAPVDPASDAPSVSVPGATEPDPFTPAVVIPSSPLIVPSDLTLLDDEEVLVSAIAIPQNKQVADYVNQFSTTRRKFLEDALARGSKYLPMIRAVFEAEGLPQDLIYLPLIESAFRTEARSHAGATGIWQMMRGTATFNGLSRDWYLDERFDPEKSTRAAAKLLKTLYGMFGDWHLSLAAYNAGAGRVQKAMKRSKRNSFWEIAKGGPKYLPRETREYVPLFLASLMVARDPIAYGLNVTSLDVPVYDVVSLAAPLDLRRAAEWLDITVEALKELNPELRRWTTPVRAAEYRLKVPAGLGALLEARLGEGAPSDLTTYVVKKGETLLGVARKLKVTRADLAEANYLATTARLQTGETLIVPRQPELVRPAPTATLAAGAPAAGGSSSLTARSLAKLVHIVRPGDTLSSIAQAYRSTVDAVSEWNGIVAGIIIPGQELTIFSDAW